MPTQTTKAAFVEPMLLLPTSGLPEGSAWAYELKLDGYDAIYYRLLLRSGPLTRRFGEELVEQVIRRHRSKKARG